MGERKVLNKYFPPDFDPKKVPRLKRDPMKQIGVRMMIPFSMQCNTCGEFMYRGKKFNSLKEDCIGEDYLGIRRFRFYIKCVICSQEITFKTDPEKGDYELETGASRNFEAWTDKQATEEKHKKAREEEEKSDNMKQLENRTLDSKIEMEIMDALDEIKAVNRRHEAVDTSEVLKASAARRERAAGNAGVADAGNKNDDDDEALIAKIQFAGGQKVHRLSDGEDSDGTSAEASNKVTDPAASGSKGKKKGKGKRGHGPPALTSFSADDEGLESSSLGQLKPKEKVRVSHDSNGSSKSSQAGNAEQQGEGAGGSRAPGTGANVVSSSGNKSSNTSGFLLVSGIEAAARREAEKMKMGSAGPVGTTIVVKRKKIDGASGKSAKKKKHKKSKDRDKERSKKKSEEGSKEATRVSGGSGGGAVGLGGLLGSYDSLSSGSDGDAKR